MMWYRHREIWTNLGLVLGYLVVFIGLGSFGLVHLSEREQAADTLQRELRIRTLQFQGAHSQAEQPERVAAWSRRLEESSELVADRRLRMAELDRAAERSGVDLVSLRELKPAEDEPGLEALQANAPVEPVDAEPRLQAAHRIGLLGSYPQVARFLDELGSGAGTVAIEDFQLRSAVDVEGAAEASLLRADLIVRWFALGEDTFRVAGS